MPAAKVATRSEPDTHVKITQCHQGMTENYVPRFLHRVLFGAGSVGAGGYSLHMGHDAGDEALAGPVAEALRPIRAEILGLRDRSSWGLSDTELLDSIRSTRALKAALEALDLSLLATLQSRPEAVPDAHPGKAAVTFLTEALRVSHGQAGRDVTAAKAVAAESGVMPVLGAALAAGEVSREHVDVAVAAVNRLPAAVKRLVTDEGTTGLQVLDGLVTEQAAP
jgi:hypothetical protein